MTSLAAILDRRVQSHPTEYRGVRMRSDLEASFAHFLDGMGVQWEYEPEPFTDVDGRGYLPDFRVGHRYFEVKPTLAEVPLAQTRMESIWRKDPDAVLIVACGEGCTFYSRTRGQPWVSWVELWRH